MAEEREEGGEERTSWKGMRGETVVEEEWKARVQSTLRADGVSIETGEEGGKDVRRGAESALSSEMDDFSGERGDFVYRRRASDGCGCDVRGERNSRRESRVPLRSTSPVGRPLFEMLFSGEDSSTTTLFADEERAAHSAPTARTRRVPLLPSPPS